MSGFRIEGNTSGNVAEVDATNQLLVALTSDETTSGYVTVTSEVDAGSITGARLVRDPEASEDYRVRVGLDTPTFSEVFPGSALNSAIWTAPVTTATVTVANGFVNLNAAGSTANAAVARVSSYRSFSCIATGVTYYEHLIQFAQLPVASNVSEWGGFIASGTSAPTDGAFFRYNASGEFRCVVNNNGVEVQSGTLNASTLVGINTTRHFVVGIGDDAVQFWIDDVLVARINRSAAGSSMTASYSIPIAMRTYNTGVTGSAQVMKCALATVNCADLQTNKLFSHVQCGGGNMGYQGPTGGTMSSTALYTNSLAPGAGAAATNTTAALGSGLGGQFALLPTLTASTDGIISSYQVPAGTAAIPGKSLYITGVWIEGLVTTVLAGGPVLGFWSLAFGHSTVTLATGADTATAKIPRRVPIGIQQWAANAAVASEGAKIYRKFDCPIVVQPGEFVQTVFKNVGTVTTTGVITFVIGFDCYWE